MQAFKIVFSLMLIFTFNLKGQKTQVKANETKKIEIDNDKGVLSISFINGVIEEFIINDIPVSKEKYSDYQEILDDFSDTKERIESVHSSSESDFQSASLVEHDENSEVGDLREVITTYLMDRGVINSFTKYKISLNSQNLKVNKKVVSDDLHQDCLRFFEEVYGHPLNVNSSVKFNKSKRRTQSSITIDS